VPGPSTTPEAPNGRPLPDQVTMGLLPYLTAHALDEDYAHVAAQRGDGDRARRRIGVAGALAIGVFALLAGTAAAQTSQDSASQERERRALIDQVKERKTAVEADRRRAAGLQVEIGRLESQQLRNTQDSGGLFSQLRLLGMRSGTSAVRGPGVEVVVDDAKNAQADRNKVLDSDMQKLVNGLWQAGAEAISINGERLTALSAIRNAGSAITVNYTKLSRPYRVLAIGNPKTLPSRFADTTSGQAWFDLQREFGLQFTMRTQVSLRLPSADVPTLRFAKSPEPNRGKRSPS
jgi:uncharacterized protein YlxW (UPF0749 family)